MAGPNTMADTPNLSRTPIKRGQSAVVSPMPNYADDIAVLGEQIQAVDQAKADATALGAANKRIDDIKVPEPSAIAPMPEAIAPQAGARTPYAREDHQHPRLTSTTYAILGANGQATISFSRTFVNKPGLNLTETDAVSTTQPLVLRGLAWQRDDQNRYTGVIIQGQRARMLPQITAVSGLLSAVIIGVNSIVAALTNFDVFAGNAAGATVSVIAVARSDVPAS